MTVTNLVTRYENIINLQSNKMMSDVKTEKNRTQYLLRGILRWKEVFCCTYHKNRLKTLLAIHQCVIVGNSPWPPGWCWWALCARSLNTINWTLMYNFLHVLCGTGAGCWADTGAAVHFGKLSKSRLIKYQIICQWSNLSKLFCAENLCSLNQSLLCIYSETHYRYLWKIASKYSSVHCPRVRHM